MKKDMQETIAAIATAAGESALSVIRVSGENALMSVDKRFQGRTTLALARTHTLHFGKMIDAAGNLLDEVVCAVFRSPHSYTGEDVVEVSCHGGTHVTRRVFESIIAAGVRPAGPGEFTQRAFLNARMDLSQAEAVADLIHAQSDKARIASLQQLEGSLSQKLLDLREQLVKMLGMLELELDFVEEGIQLADKSTMENLFTASGEKIDRLLATYQTGKIWKDGLCVALIGAPNSGKSSMLNALLNEERAIVTDIPGTTRDFLEEHISLGGILFRLFDTAGLRNTSDLIEQEGIRRTRNIIESADVIVLVHDITRGLLEEERIFLESEKTRESPKVVLIAMNKCDLKENAKERLEPVGDFIQIETSAISPAGVDKLRKQLSKTAEQFGGAGDRETVTIVNERHYASLLSAKENLALALEALIHNESGEFIAVGLRRAVDSIGEIVGLTTSEDILNAIFSKFCIGK